MSVVEQAISRQGLVKQKSCRRPSVRATTATLVSSDVLALGLSAVTALFCDRYFDPRIHLEAYWLLAALVPAAVLAYSACGLYSAQSTPVEELRKTAVVSTVFYAGLNACDFLYRGSERYPMTVFLVAWALTLVTVPNLRGLTRRLARRSTWWGYPVAVVGTPAFIERLVLTFAKDPSNSYVPVMTRTLSPRSDDASYVEDCCDSIRDVKPYCVIVGVRNEPVERILGQLLATSPRVLYVPELAGSKRFRMTARECGGAVALEMKNRLHLTHVVFLKRVFDLTVAITGGILLLPVFIVVALVVKLTSKGPVFYGDNRYGKNARQFKALKFRTMVTNQAEVLERYFQRNPKARDEWNVNQKLRRDPRVTRIGRFLRVTSLDELPQLWNVIRNDMSLVGPRPIPEGEVSRYGDVFELYQLVPPGITGLWQVSGRNNTTYKQRLELCEYYVRNWSVWLDLYILMRTVEVVLTREGAC
jgi:Undecaprenyl-phosphate galactose phosphotransferase WbaP